MKAGRPIATRRAVAGAAALLIAAALQVTALPSSAAMSPAEMIDRAWAMRRSEPTQARQYAEQALAALAERPDADLQVYAHLLLSWSSIELANDLASARRHAARARALLPAVKRRGFAAGVLVCEGGILQATGAHTQALALYEQAVVAAEGDAEAQAVALYMRGRVRGVFLGEIALGLADLRRSMTLLERLGSRAHAIAPADALYTIARLYSRIGDHAQALRYHEEELRARPPGMVASRFFTLLRIGHAQLELGNRAASQRAFDEALALARDIDGGKLQPGPLLGLAMLANARGAPGDALQLLERATAHASEAQWRLEILRERGVALRLLQRPAQSVAVLRAALRGFQQAEVAVDTSRTHGELAQALADLGDWRGAFEQYKLFKATSDDLLERQLDQRFALQKVEFDTASKERENAALKREMAATDIARRQEQRASRLQAAVLALAATLAGVLATQAWRARRASVRKLRESEERFQVAVAGSNHGIWDWDLKSDMLFLSERAQLMMGLEPTEPLQRRRDWLARIRYHPDDAASVRSALSAHLRRSTPLFDAEYRLLHADGRWVWHRQRGVAVRDAQGRPCRVAGSIEDTTPRHEAEVERSRLEAQLRRAQKLEAIGTLAGGIAHDFNNILAAIIGHGEMAQRAVPEGSAQRRHIDGVMSAGLRAKSLVERILAFSRGRVGERVPVHVQCVVSEALELIRASLPGGIRLELDLSADGAAMMGDPTQIHQVVMNLCTNAVQAMKSGGVLSVALQLIELPVARLVSANELSAGRYVRLSVRDTGSGMPREVVDRIFDPFFTTKGMGVGTGLGLSLVLGIVTDLGGGIEVESRPGAGSCFTVYLPSPEDLALTQAIRGEEGPLGTGEAVLLVDDEEPLVRLGEEMIAELGYEPVGCVSGIAALESFRAEPGRFSIVLSDEAMPEMTGSELAKAIRQVRPDIPIVLMSGYVTPALAARARALGVADVLAKPLAVRELARALANALRGTRAAAAPDSPAPPAGGVRRASATGG